MSICSLTSFGDNYIQDSTCLDEGKFVVVQVGWAEALCDYHDQLQNNFILHNNMNLIGYSRFFVLLLNSNN